MSSELISAPTRQLVIEGTRRLRIASTPPQALVPGVLRLRIDAAGICGSDVHGFVGLNARRAPGTVLGHELAGTVIEVADSATAPLLGRRVVVNPVVGCGSCQWCTTGLENLCPSRQLYGCVPALAGGMADTMVVSERNVAPIDDHVPASVAALAEPLAVGWRAARLAEGAPGVRAVVIGGGPIGLGAGLAMDDRGADVRVVEPQPSRRSALRDMGLAVVASVAEALEDLDDEVKVVLDCVGIPETLSAAVAAVGPGGVVVLVGLADPWLALAAIPVVTGERVVRGSSAYTTEDFTEAVGFLHRQASLLTRAIEREVPLSMAAQAIAAYADGTEHALKTVVNPGRDRHE